MPPSGRSQAARCTAPAKFRRDFRLIRRGRRPRRPAGAHCAPLQLKRIRVHSWDRSPHPSRPSVVPPSLSPLSLRDIIPTPFGLRPFPPDRGNRPLDKGSQPPGEGLGGRPSVPPLRVKRNIPWRAADSRPYEIQRTLRSFRRGRTLAGPAGKEKIFEIRREGQAPPLQHNAKWSRCFRRGAPWGSRQDMHRER